MTLIGVIALILLYFTEFNRFAGLFGYYVTVVEDGSILSAGCRLPLLAKTDAYSALSLL